MASAGSSTDSPTAADTAREELKEAVPEAAATLRELLDAEDERVQIRAAEAILDRAGVVKAKRVTARSAGRDVGGEDDDALSEMLK